jgi:hypothetical protein
MSVESPSNKKVWKFPYYCYKQQKPKLPGPNILHKYSSPNFEKQKLLKDTEQDLVVSNTILAITGTYELICGDDTSFFRLTETHKYMHIYVYTHTKYMLHGSKL